MVRGSLAVLGLVLAGGVAGFVGRRATRRRAGRPAVPERARAILESCPDAVIAIDAAGRVVEFNAAAERMFCYGRDEALGRDLATLIVPPALRRRHREGLARALATGEGDLLGGRVALTAMRADGEEFPAEVALVRVPLAGCPLFAAFVRDLTDRRRAEAAACRAAALRAVSLLASAAAHEINNPLSVVVGHAELLLPTADTRAADRLERILEAARRVERIVAWMRHITRLEVLAGPPEAPPMLDLARSSRPER
jgi:PAS domain S-box-containing protein